nr:hypothetical protein [Streptomyces mutabilis]
MTTLPEACTTDPVLPGPNDVVHTLIAVHTDEGITGIGSAFTTENLVRGALDLLLPHLVGQDPVEVERITETLHQTAFWMGRAARSPTRRAPSTSPCGTSPARRSGSRSADCSAGATAPGCAPTRRYSWTTPAP